jgi:hypothetical protein
VDALQKQALDTRNETQKKVDLNYVQDVTYDEEHQSMGNNIIEENGVVEESKGQAT